MLKMSILQKKFIRLYMSAKPRVPYDENQKYKPLPFTADCMGSYGAALPNRNVIWTTYISWNFLVAPLKQKQVTVKKKNTAEI